MVGENATSWSSTQEEDGFMTNKEGADENGRTKEQEDDSVVLSFSHKVRTQSTTIISHRF
jgi:hypothetical protein